VPGARLVVVPALGHLAHEEQPRRSAGLILEAARAAGLAGTAETG